MVRDTLHEHAMKPPVSPGSCLEVLAWIHGGRGDTDMGTNDGEQGVMWRWRGGGSHKKSVLMITSEQWDRCNCESVPLLCPCLLLSECTLIWAPTPPVVDSCPWHCSGLLDAGCGVDLFCPRLELLCSCCCSTPVCWALWQSRTGRMSQEYNWNQNAFICIVTNIKKNGQRLHTLSLWPHSTYWEREGRGFLHRYVD